MLKSIRTIVVAVMLGHAMPANADIYQLVGVRGETLELVAYEVFDASGTLVTQGRTDALGRFEVDRVKPGTYRLVAQWGRVALPSKDLVVDGGTGLKRIQVQSR
jgi:hypothetical protein